MGAYRRQRAGRKFRPVQSGPFDLSHAAVGSKQKKKKRIAPSSLLPRRVGWIRMSHSGEHGAAPPVSPGGHRSPPSPVFLVVAGPRPRRPSSSPVPALAGCPHRQFPCNNSTCVAALDGDGCSSAAPLAIDARCRTLCRRRPSVNQYRFEWM